MVDVGNIGWGSYKSFEGPYFPGGDNKFVRPPNPSNSAKIVAVISATEGGSYSAINMYDSCMLSCGMIQWCEAQFSVSSMIGSLVSAHPDLLAPLQPALDASEAVFKQRSDGKWRFFFGDDRGEVDSASKQHALFFKNSSGLKGAWDDDSRNHAKLWAACAASLWYNEAARQSQLEFTAKRLNGFCTKEALIALFGPGAPASNDGLVGAMRAAYYSFAANLPAVASKQLLLAIGQSVAVPWSEAWVVDVLRQLTFGSGIAIYPGRYNKIRPVLESLYSVDLPDFAEDLKQWHADAGSDDPGFLDIKQIQSELIIEGYDLGPRGADGVCGTKTKQAIADFQAANGLADGAINLDTRRALAAAHAKRII